MDVWCLCRGVAGRGGRGEGGGVIMPLTQLARKAVYLDAWKNSGGDVISPPLKLQSLMFYIVYWEMGDGAALSCPPDNRK